MIQLAQTEQQSISSLRQAAEQGNAGAQNNLGYSYAEGQGVAQDDERALFWYHKAAEQGDAEAQMLLGYRYAEGRGVGPRMMNRHCSGIANPQSKATSARSSIWV